MKTHTNDFKNAIKKFGKQLDSKITYIVGSEEIELGNENLNSVTPHYEANILKSVMKELDIDSNEEIPVGTEINYQFGVLVNNSYEYLDFGNYIVKEVEKQEDTNSWLIKCCDKMLYAMKDYEQMNITYPITIRNYINAIATQIGLTFTNASDTFVNYDKEIPQELYFDNDGNSLGYTYRDVLDDLAEVTASTIVINDDDELEIRYINDTNDTINEEYLKDVNVKFGEKYGAVNTVVLSRSAGSDKIAQSIPSDLPDENKISVVISDNLIMNDNDRAEYIPAILTQLYGLEYYLNDFSSTGIAYYDVCDKYNITVGENTYSCIMFNDEMLVTQGLQENIHTDTPDYEETDYKKTDKIDQKINQTNLIVDKQGRQITQIISNQSETDSRLNETISTLDGTIQRVSRTETNIQDIVTTTQASTGKNHLYLEDTVEGNALSYNVDGATEQQTYTGKNKCPTNFSDWESGDYSGTGAKSDNTARIRLRQLLRVNPSTTYYLNVFSSNDRFGLRTYDSSMNFVRSIGGVANESTITTDNNEYYLGIFIYSNTNQSRSYETYQTMFSNGTITPLICLNSETDKAYEQYVGGTPSPNPDYPQEVKTIPGIVNLCESTYINPTLNQYSTVLLIDGDLEPSTTYTLSFKGVNGNKVYTNENLFNQVVFTINSGITTVTVTTKSSISKTNDGQYLSGTGWKILKNASGGVANPNTFENVMLEEGSVAHEYVPYGAYARVKVTGKNIFDKENITSGVALNVNTGGTYNDSNSFLTNYVNIKGIDKICWNGLSHSTNPYTYYSFYDINKKYIEGAVLRNSIQTISIIENACYIRFSFINSYLDTLQIEQGETATAYEPYKENQVLVDMSKHNLFETDVNSNAISSYDGNTFTFKGDLSTAWYGYIGKATLEQGKTYTISSSTPFTYGRIGLSSSDTTYPKSEIAVDITPGWSISGAVIKSGGRKYLTFTSNANQTVYFWYCSDINNSNKAVFTTKISLFESNNPTPYYELCKIGDYKDILSIDSSGNCIINKNIGKVVLNGSESWKLHNELTNTNAYAINSNIGVKATGSNNIDAFINYFKGNLAGNSTDTECFWFNGNGYIRLRILKTTASSVDNFKNWLSTHNTDVYYVLAIPETITLANTKIPLFEGINHVTFVDNLETDTSISCYRKTPLTGTYATVTQLNEVNTEKTQQITQLRNEILVDLNSERLRIDAVRETIDETGVPIVKTDTGYTFDIDGLKIEKSENDVSTVVDNDGLAVSYKTTEILTARSNGVEAENITTRKFYVQKPIRMEKTKSISDGSSIGLGFFYVGE